VTRPDGEPERPVGPAVDPTPARRPDAVSLSGRFGSVERLDAGRHGEPLWEALAGHDRVWTYMAYGPFADRGAFLAGDYQRVYDEIIAVKEACGSAHLKVILETGELGTYDAVRRASILAMAAGADFIKTSTGKVQPAATLPVSLVMMEAIRDFVRETGRPVGFKAAGGIRTSKQAIAYLVLLYETLGADWMTPDRFRLGASTLLNDVLMQIDKERSGVYQSPDYFTID